VWENYDGPSTAAILFKPGVAAGLFMEKTQKVAAAAGEYRIKGMLDQAFTALLAPKVNDTVARGLGFSSAQEYTEHNNRVYRERVAQVTTGWEKATGATIGSVLSLLLDAGAGAGVNAAAPVLNAMKATGWARVFKLSAQGGAYGASYEALRQVADEGGINSAEEVMFFGGAMLLGLPALDKIIRVGLKVASSTNQEAVLKLIEKRTQQAVVDGKSPQAAFDEALLRSGYTSEEISSIVGTTKRGVAWKDQLPPLTDADIKQSVFAKTRDAVFHPAVAALSAVKEGAEFFITPISTIIRYKAPALLNWMRKNVLESNLYKQGLLDRLGKLPEVIQMFPGRQREVFLDALSNGRRFMVNKMVDNLPKAQRNVAKPVMEDMRKLMDGMLAEEQGAGIKVAKIEDYWPHGLKDGALPSLRKTLGLAERSEYDNMIKHAIEKNGGKDISRAQKEDILETYLRGRTPDGFGQPGFAKSRRIDVITPEIKKHYLDPYTSALRRVEKHVYAMSRRKFFGQHMKNADLDATGEDSITSFLMNLIERGEIYSKDMHSLQGAIEAFMGYKPSPKWLQGAKNIFYASKIGQFSSGLTQIGDIGIAGFVNGLHNSIQGIFRAGGKKGVSPMRGFGLQHYAEEFASTGKTAKMLDISIKGSLFKHWDLLGKTVHVNGAMVKNERLVNSARGIREFRRKWAPFFGAETEDLISDLQNKKMSDNVRLLLWNELSDVQPVSLLEMPEAYLRSPKGRVFYALKTFGLRQLDLIRREAIHEIKEGNVFRGTKNLARYTFFVTAANSTAEQMKNFISGRPFDFTDWQFSHMLKTLMVSEYLVDQLAKGNRQAETIAEQLMAAPIGMGEMVFDVAGDMAKFAEGTLSLQTSESLQHAPLARAYYNLFGAGMTRYRAKREKEMYGSDDEYDYTE
jgi:hypothetical protein